MTLEQIETFTAAYITALLWAETNDDGDPIDKNHTPEDINEDSRLRINADCASFCYANAHWIGDAIEQAGHDFWLTRNGHGAGFWDREAGVYPHDYSGEAMTKAANAFGQLDCQEIEEKVYIS